MRKDDNGVPDSFKTFIEKESFDVEILENGLLNVTHHFHRGFTHEEILTPYMKYIRKLFFIYNITDITVTKLR